MIFMQTYANELLFGLIMSIFNVLIWIFMQIYANHVMSHQFLWFLCKLVVVLSGFDRFFMIFMQIDAN